MNFFINVLLSKEEGCGFCLDPESLLTFKQNCLSITLIKVLFSPTRMHKGTLGLSLCCGICALLGLINTDYKANTQAKTLEFTSSQN